MNLALLRQITVVVAVGLIGAIYGVFARGHDLFPTNLVQAASKLYYTSAHGPRSHGKLNYYYIPVKDPRAVIAHHPDRMSPGLTLINGIGPNETLFVHLVDEQGRTQQSWSLDWNRIWPHPTHLSKAETPANGHGVLSLGAVVSENGDLTFNFEHLGMVQLDVCGRVKWKLPRQSNHSLFRDEAGNFWTQEVIDRTTPLPGLQNYKLPFEEHFVLEVSPTGKILRELSVIQLLRKNEYNGLLFMKSEDTWSTAVTGDPLHITSIDVFPATMKSGLFKAGDILLSLNAINTVVVFDPETQVVKATLTGRFLRQSDADFVDGDTISIFDNHNISSDRVNGSSRIIEHSFKTGKERVLFEGDPSHPFYTPIMGRHELLPNGNMLVTEGTKGRVLEIDPKGVIAWEYFNVLNPHTLGIIAGADRVPPSTLSSERLARLKAACPA